MSKSICFSRAALFSTFIPSLGAAIIICSTFLELNGSAVSTLRRGREKFEARPSQVKIESSPFIWNDEAKTPTLERQIRGFPNSGKNAEFQTETLTVRGSVSFESYHGNAQRHWNHEKSAFEKLVSLILEINSWFVVSFNIHSL